MGKEGLSDSRKRMIFIVIMVTCILCSMLSTALTTALPQMMLEFGISAGEGQWLTSVYSLVMGIMVLATAYLIRRFRTKRLYMVSLALFTLGLFLDGITTSFVTMMVGRIFQAAGNGILLSLGQVVLLTIYPKEKRGSIMSQSYTPEFKKKIVRLHIEEGRTYKSITAEYGVSKASISKWCAEFSEECHTKAQQNPDAPNDLELMKENLRLRKELEEAKKENLFLKKAAAFFAKEID